MRPRINLNVLASIFIFSGAAFCLVGLLVSFSETLPLYYFLLPAGGLLMGLGLGCLAMESTIRRMERNFCCWSRFAALGGENALELSRHQKKCAAKKPPDERGPCNCDQALNENALVQCKIEGGGYIDLRSAPDDIQVIVGGVHVLPGGLILVRRKPTTPAQPYDWGFGGLVGRLRGNTHIDKVERA